MWVFDSKGNKRWESPIGRKLGDPPPESFWGGTRAKAALVPEREAKKALRPVLTEHFKVKEEVTGRGPKGQTVKIDFWCYPRDSTIAKGWPARWFGVEVKGYGLQDQRGRAAVRLLHQAQVYRNSQFPTPDGEAYPDVVLIYPTFVRLLFSGPASEGDYDENFTAGMAHLAAKIAAMDRIMELAFAEDGKDFEVWAHGINRWYHSHWGRSSFDCLGAEDLHASR